MTTGNEEKATDQQEGPGEVSLSKSDATQEIWIHIKQVRNNTSRIPSERYVDHLVLKVSDIESMSTKLCQIYSGSHLLIDKLYVKTKTETYALDAKLGEKFIAVFEACRLCLRVDHDET